MAFLLLCITWVSWGVSYPVTAIALAGFDVMTLRCTVQIVGALALLSQIVLAGRSFAVEREGWRDLAVSGLLNMAVFPICMNLGVHLMSPGRTSILVYTMPVWACLFARVMLGERLSRSRIAALLLGGAAVVAMVSQDLSGLRNGPLGAGLTILAAMSFGLGTVWLKRRHWRADPSVVAFWQLAVGIVPLVAVWIALAAGVRQEMPDISQAGWPQWLSLLFLGAVANGLAYFAWFRMVRVLPAGVLGISSLAVPCIGVSSSAWLADEHLSGRDLLAIALIFAALATVLAEQLGLRRLLTRVPFRGAGRPRARNL